MGLTKVVLRPAIHVGEGTVTIVDNLTSDSPTSALSAKQGKVLKQMVDALDPGSGTVPAQNVVQDTEHRFVTDAEKSTWNGKQNELGFTPVATNDARLSDARPPTPHEHTIADVDSLEGELNSKATPADIAAAIAALIDGAPGAIDTLNELAAALGDDPNFATTITNLIAGKEALANKAENLTAPNHTKYPTVQAVVSALLGKANSADVYSKTETDAALAGKAAVQTVAAISGASTLADSDMNTIMRKTGNLTIAPNASVPIPNASTFTIQQSGSGPVSIIPGSGVTLIPPYGVSLQGDGSLQLRGDLDAFSAVKESTNIWRFFGPAPAGSEPDPVMMLIKASAGAIRIGTNPADLTSATRKLLMFGDSQGTPLYADPSMEEQLAAFFPDWDIINGCVSGQNSRNIDEDGSSAFINTNGNVDWAIEQGADVALIVDTSNDAYSGASGGVVPLGEWQTRISRIVNKLLAAGVLPLVLTPFPRSSLITNPENLIAMHDWMVENLGPYVVHCFYEVQDPNTPGAIRPGYGVGDGIHLNGTGGMARVCGNVRERLFFHHVYVPSNVKEYRVYFSSTSGGTFTLNQTITDPLDTNVTGLAAGWYKAQALFVDGSLSTLSRAVQVTAVMPVANAGADQSLSPGTTTATLTGSASTGEELTYLWEFVSGPNTPTITSPAAAVTGVTGMVNGNYVFKLTVEDVHGQTDEDTTGVAIQATLIDVRYTFSKTSRPISGWNNIIGGPLLGGTGGNLVAGGKTWADTAGGTTAVLRYLAEDATEAAFLFGADYAGTGNAVDDSLGAAVDGFRSGWFSNAREYDGPSRYQWSEEGFNPNSYVTAYCYSSRQGTLDNGNPTVWVFAGVTGEINANSSNTTILEVKNIPVDANGKFLWGCYRKFGVSGYGFQNGVRFVQQTAFIP